MKKTLLASIAVLGVTMVAGLFVHKRAQAGLQGCGNGTPSCNNNGVCGAFTAGGCIFTESRASCRDCRVCGDGVLDLGEGCDDGNRVSGDGCDANCKNEDPCAVHSRPGISNPTVQACVCNIQPACCNSSWGQSCLQIGEVYCGTKCDCQQHAPGSIYPFPDVDACICDSGGGGQFMPDPYCCENWWDGQCIGEAQMCGISCQ